MTQKLFNMSDYAILEVLIHYDCTSPIASFSKEQISKKTNFSMPKIRNTLNTFLMFNIIAEGAKDGKKKTYYVTEKGIQHYQDAYNWSDDALLKELGKKSNIKEGV